MKAEYINHMGDDLSVVNAARVSFDKESEWEPCDSSSSCPTVWTEDDRGNWVKLSEADAKLIRYLAKHNHWTPFAHTSIQLRMKAPVPIRTQCFKHKAGFTENEESRRYISSTPELFVPKVFRSKPEGSVKQGSGAAHSASEGWKAVYTDFGIEAINMYEQMIAEGICPEQARLILPQGCYVNWIWTGNLASFARFYNQRTDPHAQKEIQELAEMVGEIIQPLFPVSWAALTKKD